MIKYTDKERFEYLQKHKPSMNHSGYMWSASIYGGQSASGFDIRTTVDRLMQSGYNKQEFIPPKSLEESLALEIKSLRDDVKKLTAAIHSERENGIGK